MNKPESQKFVNYIKAGRKILIYDTETTGLNMVTDVIVEYSAMVMEKINGRYQVTESFEQYIRPKFKMPEKATECNGITDEFLQNYPYEEEAYQAIKQFLDRHADAVICGYNQYKYDDAMMYNLHLRQGELSKEHPDDEIDVFTMVKENIFEKNRNLSSMHALLCPEIEDIQFHNSSDDIRATWNVAVALYNRLIKEEKKYAELIVATPVRCRTWEPGGGKKYLFVTVKTDNNYAELYYDFYYKTWKSKEVDPAAYNTDKIEEFLISKFGSLKNVTNSIQL